jgi:hypothetical protein
MKWIGEQEERLTHVRQASIYCVLGNVKSASLETGNFGVG